MWLRLEDKCDCSKLEMPLRREDLPLKGKRNIFNESSSFDTVLTYCASFVYYRSQIVRLDARWIAMLRYHLGCGFEDIFIPASGETDSQLGNTLPTQGFVEITIKDLESMLHVEVSRLWSKGIIDCFSESKAHFDVGSHSLSKQGKFLKKGDFIRRKIDAEGKKSVEYHRWKVVDAEVSPTLSTSDLQLGASYGIYVASMGDIQAFKLTSWDIQSRELRFSSQSNEVNDIVCKEFDLPSIYPPGTSRHANVKAIVVQSVVKSSKGGYIRETLPMSVIQDKKYSLDIGETHVVECIGKPHGSKVHLGITTEEPYGVCCISGAKVSMNMHNFGEKRFGSGLTDDILSVTSQNTRIIGKSVIYR
jgi:hypothetical protein